MNGRVLCTAGNTIVSLPQREKIGTPLEQVSVLVSLP